MKGPSKQQRKLQQSVSAEDRAVAAKFEADAATKPLREKQAAADKAAAEREAAKAEAEEAEES